MLIFVQIRSFDFVLRQNRTEIIQKTGSALMVAIFRRGTKQTAEDLYFINHIHRNICVYVDRVSEYIQTTPADQVTTVYQIISCEFSQG